MPYTHRKVGDKNCVYKKDTGAKVGCTNGSVKKYLAALYINANESITEVNTLKGGKADKLSIQQIADKFDVPVKKIKNQLQKGIGVEMEHTNDKEKATEIATDHISEFPDYYDRLDKMETKAKKEWKTIKENNKSLIKNLLRETLFDRFKKIIFKQTPNIWTHTTDSEELINKIKNGGEFIGKKEDLNNFNVPMKGSFATFTNQNAPNFKKGSLFSGFESKKYLITTDLLDNAFQPNWNAKNYDNFEDSQNVGVLKPEFRKSKNFKLWEKNKNDEFELMK